MPSACAEETRVPPCFRESLMSIKLLEIEISNLIHYFQICSGNLIFLLHDIVYCLLTCGLHEYC